MSDADAAAAPHGRAVAVNVLGTLGAVFWSVQLLPQIWLNWRRGHTRGLQPSMMLLWAAAGLPLGIHNILAELNVALQVQAQILTALSLVTWAQVMYLGHKWSMLKTLSVTGALMALAGGVELAFVCGFRYGAGSVPSGFILAMAILAAVGLGLGVGRHYVDMYQHRSVRGISWGFVFLDAGGDLFSLLSVLLERPLSAASIAIYATELLLWLGVMAAGLAWNVPQWYRSRRGVERRSEASERQDDALEMEPSSAPADALEDDAASSTHSVFRTSGWSRLTRRLRDAAQPRQEL